MSISGVGSGVSAYMRSFQPPSFSTIDSNSSGDITLDELKAGAPGGASDTKSAERAEQLFSAMDADGNGSVSSDEKDAFDAKLLEQVQSMAFMAQQFGGAPPPAGNDDIFAATDADGSGSVSLEEFSSSDAADGLSSEALSELFSTIDADGDGAISETESSDFLDSLKSAMGDRPMGPPPGGPPPGGEASTDDSEEDDSSTRLALDLLTAARAAYSTTSGSDDLLSTLSKVFDQAA